MAKWALGLRLKGATDEVVELAFTNGSILRTHIMRPTWHFVTPADIRWMLALTAPRVNAIGALYFRKLELDQAVFSKSHAAITKALQGGNMLTRDELRGVLEAAGVPTRGPLRMGYIMMRAELDGIISSGPRRGKRFTYVLLEERVPQVPRISRDEALAELARRFYLSHGPATVHDYSKWSGLTVGDARIGLESVKNLIVHEELNGRTYWFTPPTSAARMKSPTAFLLPIYDEYTIGYKEHSAVFDMSKIVDLVFAHTLVIDGQVSGAWKRTLKKDSVIIETNTVAPLTAAERASGEVAAHQYGKFLSLSMALA